MLYKTEFERSVANLPAAGRCLCHENRSWLNNKLFLDRFSVPIVCYLIFCIYYLHTKLSMGTADENKNKIRRFIKYFNPYEFRPAIILQYPKIPNNKQQIPNG